MEILSSDKTIEVQQFFEQWHLYKTIIDNNYMNHNDIANYLINHINAMDHNSNIRILELGCGDSSMLARVLHNTNKTIDSYYGIDLSSMALELGEKNLQGKATHLHLIMGDMVSELSIITQHFDLILAGYSLHHLMYETKQQLLKQCHGCLTTNGKLLIYDLLNNENEDPQNYLHRCVNYFSKHWKQLTTDQLQQVSNHVLNYDYPESIQSWKILTQQSGFTNCEIKLRDENEMYAMLEIYR